MDLGPPASYMTLRPGVPVYSSDERKLGEVQHVLADADVDVFDGFVLDTSVLPGGLRFVDAPEVAEIFDRGVLLSITAAEAEGLPKPSANPAELSVGPDDMVPGGRHDKLRRAWDLISGKG